MKSRRTRIMIGLVFAALGYYFFAGNPQPRWVMVSPDEDYRRRKS